MNKAAHLYNEFLRVTGDRDTAKECVLTFIVEFEKFLTGEFAEHSEEWRAYRMQEIREDLQLL